MVKAKWLGIDLERAVQADADHGDSMTMVTVMGIEKHAAFYRGYQPDDRSLIPVAIVLAMLVAVWLLVYLVSAVGPMSGPATVQPPPHGAYAVRRPTNN